MCCRMKIFCRGILRTPKLQGIMLFDKEQEWEGSLNATVACQLTQWVGGHLEGGQPFRNLESLEVVKDAIASKAILANQLQFLKRLRKIIVRDCESVQVVFDLEGLSAEDGHVWLLPQLNELELINLPLLTQLCNKVSRHVLDFNKLTVLKIENCSRLKYAFTWSMCLFQLQSIELRNCKMMETIMKEEEVEDETGTGDLECPSLKKISIRECPRIKAFISTLEREDTQARKKIFMPAIRFFPILKSWF